MFEKAVGKTVLEIAIIIALGAWVLERIISSPIHTAVVAVIVLAIVASIIPGGTSSRILGKGKGGRK